MAQFRYRPKGNRTPVNHPVYGHLQYDGVYEDPAMAEDPDFQEIKDDDAKSEPAEETAAGKAPEAGKPGRSK